VADNAKLQEEIEFRHKRPNIDKDVDTLDLGLGADPNTSAFVPPKANNIGNN